MSELPERFKLAYLADGRVKVKCGRCYEVSRSGWRRPKLLADDITEVGAWVNGHTCTQYRTERAARTACVELAHRPDSERP